MMVNGPHLYIYGAIKDLRSFGFPSRSFQSAPLMDERLIKQNLNHEMNFTT